MTCLPSKAPMQCERFHFSLNLLALSNPRRRLAGKLRIHAFTLSLNANYKMLHFQPSSQDSTQLPDETQEETSQKNGADEIDSPPTTVHKFTPTKQIKKRKCDTATILEKACSIMSKEEDEFDTFGSFVASEIRHLKKEKSRRTLKRIIQTAILDAADNDAVELGE